MKSGALLIVKGGDHSINIPCIDAFSEQEPIHVVQIDAHLDFVDERHGVCLGHGSPLRRAAEKSYVTELTQIGIRNVSSTAREGYEDARRMGSDTLSARQFRKLGVDAVLQRIPAGKHYYVTIDIDGLDPSIALGTGTPSHGGFIHYEILVLLAGLVKRGPVVGVDLVEVAPDSDQTGSTAILVAQLLLNFIGRIMHQRKQETEGGISHFEETGWARRDGFSSGSGRHRWSGLAEIGSLHMGGLWPILYRPGQRFFKEEGVDFELVIMEDTPIKMGALMAGQLDLVASTVDEFPIYMKPGIGLHYVLAVDNSKGGDGIVANKDIADIKSLKGKKVAF